MPEVSSKLSTCLPERSFDEVCRSFAESELLESLSELPKQGVPKGLPGRILGTTARTAISVDFLELCLTTGLYFPFAPLLCFVPASGDSLPFLPAVSPVVSLPTPSN